MLNLINKKALILLTVALITSCSANKKNTDLSQQNQSPELKTLSDNGNSEITEETMFSVSADEIKKSGTKPYVVYFDTNGTKLDKEAVNTLKNNVLPDAKGANAKKIVIEAHSDERGSKIYNQKLSQKRANAVKSYLAQNGVESRKIKAIGYGEDKPVALGHNEESWAKNRRAVTIVIKR